jgi:hypothetical protein
MEMLHNGIGYFTISTQKVFKTFTGPTAEVIIQDTGRSTKQHLQNIEKFCLHNRIDQL